MVFQMVQTFLREKHEVKNHREKPIKLYGKTIEHYFRGNIFKGKMWRFPKMGVSLNHQILIGFFILNHPFWGSTIYGNPHVRKKTWEKTICNI